MNLYLRLFVLSLLVRFRPRVSIWVGSRTPFRVLPNDLDVNRHMNNARYLAFCDLGRLDLMIRSGYWKEITGREHPEPGGDCLPGQGGREQYAARGPQDLQPAREPALLGGLGEGRQVRDQVVEQDPERREPDHRSQVDGEHEQADHDADGDLGVVRHVESR